MTAINHEMIETTEKRIDNQEGVMIDMIKMITEIEEDNKGLIGTKFKGLSEKEGLTRITIK